MGKPLSMGNPHFTPGGFGRGGFRMGKQLYMGHPHSTPGGLLGRVGLWKIHYLWETPIAHRVDYARVGS